MFPSKCPSSLVSCLAVLGSCLLLKSVRAGEVETVTGFGAPDPGNWTVQNCIRIKMSSEIVMRPSKDTNTTIVMDIPPSAIADGDCSLNDTQTLDLIWKVPDLEFPGFYLNRNLTLIFKKNTTMSPEMYGVSKIDAIYQTKHFNKTVKRGHGNETVYENKTFVEYISMSTFTDHPIFFLIPVNRSYLCIDVGTLTLISELHSSDEKDGAPGERLPNATFTATNVQFDAFRGDDIPPNVLQSPLDCSFRPSDIVPIIVGCALAGTVLMVLIAYLVGRRRSRARGYQSV